MNARKEKIPELCLCSPAWLNPEKMSAQQNRSMLGQRTRFLKLHRYVDGLSDDDLKKALNTVKAKFAYENKTCPNDSFTDTKILEDVIHHETMIRDGYSVDQIEDILESYLCNVRLAEQFQDVTSEHMINELQKTF